MCVARMQCFLVCVTVCVFLCPRNTHTPQQSPLVCAFLRRTPRALCLYRTQTGMSTVEHTDSIVGARHQASGGPWRTNDGRRFGVDPLSGHTKWLPDDGDGNVAITENKNGKRPVSEVDSMAGAAAARKNAKADGQAVAGVDTPMVPTQSAEEVSPTGPTLAGEFADAEIRVGDDYQAVVPEWDPKLASAAATCDERGDELLDIKYKKLTKPPGLPTVPVPPKASAETEESAVAPKSSGPSVTEEEYDVDEDGLPILPAGCCVGAFCLAYGTNAGQRKQFKAKIMAVRELYPHVLVKYVGDASGSTSALLLPEVRNSYVAVREVQAWQRLVTPPTEVEESSFNGGGSTDEETVRRPTLRARQHKDEWDGKLHKELCGMRLHLDPKRNAEGYSGTGYKGVGNDYWHTGYKKVRPYTVTFEGKYQGRFATVEEAAVWYARLEMGMPPVVLSEQKSKLRGSHA